MFLTRDGHVLVGIRATADYAEVILSDNGRGVPEEDRDYIFEKFYQSKNQNTLKPSGSGFGLAICRKIIEGHQGSIWLDTSCQSGARFVLRIPRIA